MASAHLRIGLDVDHIPHLFMETDPRWAPAAVVSKIKVSTSRALRAAIDRSASSVMFLARGITVAHDAGIDCCHRPSKRLSGSTPAASASFAGASLYALALGRMTALAAPSTIIIAVFRAEAGS
jgi:hypothetical protein